MNIWRKFKTWLFRNMKSYPQNLRCPICGAEGIMWEDYGYQLIEQGFSCSECGEEWTWKSKK